MNGKYRVILQKSDSERTNRHGPLEYWTLDTCPRLKALLASLTANGATYTVTETPIGCTAASYADVVAMGGTAKRSKVATIGARRLPPAMKQAACVKAEREAIAAIPERGWNMVFSGLPMPGSSYAIDGNNPAGRVTFSLPLESRYMFLEKNKWSDTPTLRESDGLDPAAFRAPWSDLLTLCRDLSELGIEFRARYELVEEIRTYSQYGGYTTVPAHYAATLSVEYRETTNDALGALAESRRADLVAGEHEYWQEMASLARDHETARKPSESAWTPTELSNGDAWRPKMQPAVVLTGSGLAVMKQRTGYGRKACTSWFVIHAASGKAIHAEGMETVETAKTACLKVRDAVQGIDWNATAAELTAHGPTLATRINEAIAA